MQIKIENVILQGKYAELDASTVSYGPCQTPTLGTVVRDRLGDTVVDYCRIYLREAIVKNKKVIARNLISQPSV